MLQQLVLRLRPQSVNCLVKRNIAVSSALYAKGQDVTPIQKLFVDKIRDYAKQAGGGSMLDKDPEIKKELEAEKARLHKMYGGGDLSQFPELKFNEVDFAEGGKQ